MESGQGERCRHVEIAEVVFPFPSPDTSQAQYWSPTTFAPSSGLLIVLSAWNCPVPPPHPHAMCSPGRDFESPLFSRCRTSSGDGHTLAFLCRRQHSYPQAETPFSFVIAFISPGPSRGRRKAFTGWCWHFSEGCEVDSTLLSFEVGKNFLRQGLTLSLPWHPKEEKKTCNKKSVRM